MTSTTSEIVWLRSLLTDMDEHLCHPNPIDYDSQSVVLITNSVFHKRTKHIEIECHVTRHHLQLRTIALLFVSSSFQIVDIFTKTHFTSCFHFFN